MVLCSSYMVFGLAVGQHLLLLGGNIGEFYTSKYIGLCSLVVILPLEFLFFQCAFASFFCSFGFSCQYFQFFWQFIPITVSAFVTCSICIFGDRRLASKGLQTLVKGTLDQCHLHTVPTYFLWTLNRQLFARELHQTTKYFFRDFGCVCVGFDSIKFFTFRIFLL